VIIWIISYLHLTVGGHGGGHGGGFPGGHGGGWGGHGGWGFGE